MIYLPVFEKYEAVLQVPCSPVVFGENKIRFRKDGERIFFLAPLRLYKKKIISPKAAKSQRDSVFLCDLASLREKKSFHAKTPGRKGGGYAQISGISPHIFPQLLT
jgi:hypothetical protein